MRLRSLLSLLSQSSLLEALSPTPLPRIAALLRTPAPSLLDPPLLPLPLLPPSPSLSLYRPCHSTSAAAGASNTAVNTATQMAATPTTTPVPQAWDGSASQDGLMLHDQCILVNEADAILGQSSKLEAHRFDARQPRGRLHRAFSVFLFDSQNRLLLQQRAHSKITFPGVWTNTCCSHPLYGQLPSGELIR